MTENELGRIAVRLLADYDAKTPRERCFRQSGLTIRHAYEIQAAVARLREQRGDKVQGYKIGCTSRSVQEQLGVDQPIFGRIYESGCFPSGAQLRSEDYVHLAVEGELAVRLAHDLSDPRASDGDVLRAIEAVFPVIELHNFVLCDPGPSCAELIAHNGMHAGWVAAKGEAGFSGRPEAVTSLSVLINDSAAGVVAQPWTMGGPAASLRWLAARLAEFGVRLERGQTVLTGAPLPLFPVGPGTRIVVEAPPLGRSCADVVPYP
jgi:2-keto-4-pentenoate hydratase